MSDRIRPTISHTSEEYIRHNNVANLPKVAEKQANLQKLQKTGKSAEIAEKMPYDL